MKKLLILFMLLLVGCALTERVVVRTCYNDAFEITESMPEAFIVFGNTKAGDRHAEAWIETEKGYLALAKAEQWQMVITKSFYIDIVDSKTVLKGRTKCSTGMFDDGRILCTDTQLVTVVHMDIDENERWGNPEEYHIVGNKLITN